MVQLYRFLLVNIIIFIFILPAYANLDNNDIQLLAVKYKKTNISAIPLASSVSNIIIKSASKSSAEKRQDILSTLNIVVENIKKEKDQSRNEKYKEILESLSSLLKKRIEDPSQSVVSEWVFEVPSNQDKFYLNGDPSIDIYNASSSLDISEATKIVDYVLITHNIMNNLFSQDAEKSYQSLKHLNKKWDNYFNTALSQYPWELAANEGIYSSNRSSMGLNEPPNYQVILFHPSLAYEYINKSNTKNSIIIELGYNGWGWDENGSMTYPLLGISGISFIGNYSNHADINAPDWGYGILLHYKTAISIGVVQYNNDTGVVVNYDFTKYFLDQAKAIQDKYRFGYLN